MKPNFILLEIFNTICAIIGAVAVVLGGIGIYGYIIYFIGSSWFRWW